MPMTTKLGTIMTYLEGFLLLWSRDKLNHFSTSTTPIAIKFGKVVTYHEELPFIKLLDPQSRGFVRSHDILNTLYLHLHLTNRH